MYWFTVYWAGWMTWFRHLLTALIVMCPFWECFHSHFIVYSDIACGKYKSIKYWWYSPVLISISEMIKNFIKIFCSYFTYWGRQTHLNWLFWTFSDNICYHIAGWSLLCSSHPASFSKELCSGCRRGFCHTKISWELFRWSGVLDTFLWSYA